MGKTITYGEGGYDPSKPNDNIIEIIDIPDEESSETGVFTEPVLDSTIE